MMTPSRKPVDQPWLNRQYNDNAWADRLAPCRKLEVHNSLTPAKHGQVQGTLTIGHDYYDAENRVIATIFYYLKPNGELGASGKKTPKGLLIDGVWCYI
jgi:hypothetical protein